VLLVIEGWPHSPLRAVEAFASFALQGRAGFRGAELGQDQGAGGGEAFAGEDAPEVRLADFEERLAKRFVSQVGQNSAPRPGGGLAIGQGGGAIGDVVETGPGVHAANRGMTTGAVAGGSISSGGVSRRALAAWLAQ
jgi:hypothetical protein